MKQRKISGWYGCYDPNTTTDIDQKFSVYYKLELSRFSHGLISGRNPLLWSEWSITIFHGSWSNGKNLSMISISIRTSQRISNRNFPLLSISIRIFPSIICSNFQDFPMAFKATENFWSICVVMIGLIRHSFFMSPRTKVNGNREAF